MEETIEAAIELLSLGFEPHYKGFGYLSYAITRVASKFDCGYVGKIDVYGMLSDKFELKRGNLSRCMQHSISSAWEVTGTEELYSMFSDHGKEDCPPVLKVVYRIATKIAKQRRHFDGERGMIIRTEQDDGLSALNRL